MASPTQWIGVWATPKDSEGQWSLVCCGAYGHRVGHDLLTEQHYQDQVIRLWLLPWVLFFWIFLEYTGVPMCLSLWLRKWLLCWGGLLGHSILSQCTFGRKVKKKQTTSFWAAEEEKLVISMSSCFPPWDLNTPPSWQGLPRWFNKWYKEPTYQCRRLGKWFWFLGWEDPLE